MSPSFNLLKEPFIPCVGKDGSRSTVSIPTALQNAGSFHEILDNSPLVTIGLHRLLLAVLHAALRGPTSETAWKTIHTSKDWGRQRLEDYFAKWVDRFDLFHPTYPFFQRARFTDGKRVGANKLAAEITETNVKLMFSHVSDEDPPLFPFDEVARQLIAHQSTTGQGGRGYGASPLSRGAVVLARGKNLFETLLFNLMRYKVNDNEPVFNHPSDAPAWEIAANPCTAPETPNGLIDLYTWQSRSVLLLPDGSAEGVRWMHYGPGRMFRSEATVFDPAMAYRELKDGAIRAIGFDENKALWRDSGAILEFGSESRYRRPPWMHQLSKIKRDESIEIPHCRMAVLGTLSDSAKVKFWRHESLPLPLAYLHNEPLVQKVREILSIAEDVANILRDAAKKCIEAWLITQIGQRPDAERVRQALKSFAPDRFYWSKSEQPFQSLFTEMASDGADLDSCRDDWFWNALYPIAKRAFDDSIGRIDGGRDLKAVNAGRGVLLGRLNAIRESRGLKDRTKEGDA